MEEEHVNHRSIFGGGVLVKWDLEKWKKEKYSLMERGGGEAVVPRMGTKEGVPPPNQRSGGRSEGKAEIAGRQVAREVLQKESRRRTG